MRKELGMTQMPAGYNAAVTCDGFTVVRQVLTPDEVAALSAVIDAALAESPPDAAVRDRGGVFALRNLIDVVPALASLPAHPQIRALVEPVLGPQAFLVKGLLFDKTPASNWGVFWHQDLTIAVRERAESEGFRGWTRKAGIVHVQPPAAVLERMLTVRLSLDDCTSDAGPLKVLPGSHRHARLTAAETHHWQAAHMPVECVVPAGGAVVMRPLLLHSSSKAASVAHRRVIHLEFAADELPAPLQWNLRLPIIGSMPGKDMLRSSPAPITPSRCHP